MPAEESNLADKSRKEYVGRVEPIPTLQGSRELSYTAELTRSMSMLADHPKTLFIGQSTRYDGQAMHKTFSGVPMDRRIEFPVAEDFQMGFCTGLALEGYIPVCCYPRMDFLLLAANQLVNHLDKLSVMSKGKWSPHVIIRTAVGSTSPLNPGPQHIQDHSNAFMDMTTSIFVNKLLGSKLINYHYQKALKTPGVHLMVEYMGMYD